jgi:hypothetical protein
LLVGRDGERSVAVANSWTDMIGSEAMETNDPESDQANDAQSPGPPGPDDVVITPGGPALRKNVHLVEPGEAVRADPDGDHTIVRETQQ